MDRNLKKKVLAWRDKIGYAAAKQALMRAGYSLSLAQKVLAGTYPDQPKIDKMNILYKAMGEK